MKSPVPAARLDQLTSLRFFAALAVLASHLYPLADEPNPLQPIGRTLFHEGYVGVSFFFMLSGYILAHTYQARLVGGLVSRRKYLALRLARIVPLHWLTGLPFAVVLLWRSSDLGAIGGKILVNFALLQAWVPDSDWYFSVNQPSWSLSDEMFFYASFAFLAFLPVRKLGMAVAGLTAFNLAVVVWLVAHGQTTVRTGDDHIAIAHWLTYIDPVARLLDFMIGMLLYSLRGRMMFSRYATLAEIGAGALLLAVMTVFPLVGLLEPLRFQLAYLPFVALVLHVFGGGAGAVSGVLSRNRWLILLGDASFALYLVQSAIVTKGIALQEWLGDDVMPLPLWAALECVVAVAASLVVHLMIERPMQKRLRPAIDRIFSR